MKKFLLLFFIPLFNLTAQIPNGSFENWTTIYPDNWFTVNMPGIIPVTQVTPGQQGNFSARGEVMTFNGETAIPYMLSDVIPFEQRPASLTGYFQFYPQPGDEFTVYVFLAKDSSVVGAGVFTATATVNSFTQFFADIFYISGEDPDNMIIQITVEGPNTADPTPGTFYIVDNLEFSTLTSVADDPHDLNEFKLYQNYPNPFNPSTVIAYSIPVDEMVTIKIHDVLGNETAVLLNEFQKAGEHRINFDATGFSNGVYFYSVTAGNFNETKKMILQK